MLVKLTSELVSAIGATNASDALSKIAALAAKPTVDMSQIETLTASVAALESRLAALESKPTITGCTEARVIELMAGDDGKKIIAAEASRIFLEAGAATGTQPAKPSPAPAVPVVNQANDLIAAGKYDEAYAASAEIRAEFPDAGCFAAYAKAEAQGRVHFANSKPSTN